MLDLLQKFSILVGSQLRYGRKILIYGLILLSASGLTASLTFSQEKALGKSWAMLILLAGMLMSVLLWSQDMRERRQLGWLAMPITPGLGVFARMAIPVYVHLAILIPFLACVPLWISRSGMDAPRVFERVLGLHAFSLTMCLLIYLSEELTVLLARWGAAGVIALQIVLVGGFLAAVAVGDRLGLPDIDSVPGIGASYFCALVCGALTVLLYRRRSNYLLGVDACTSMPVDWGTSRG